MSLSASGADVIITHEGRAGRMQIKIAAARLEKWATKIIREEAFVAAPDTQPAEAQP